MSVDESVIAAISSAVEQAPENTALRLHLISLLLNAGKYEAALDNCNMILSKQPDHLEVLLKAAIAAEGMGDLSQAKGFQRIHSALSGNQNNDQEEEASKPKQSEKVPLRLIHGASKEADENIWETEEPKVRLSDVAGMEEVKRRLNLSLLSPIKNPGMMKMFGKSLHGGLMLYGPPGCGKTFIARATAGELGAKFVSVGLSEVLDMYIGQSERNLHEIFETARRNAPCVLFFDEIDALGRKRSLMRHSAGANVINQLLAEMDSIGSNNKGVFVLAASNHPWDVDTALRRPGRLDRILLVLPPDQLAREAILKYHTSKRPLSEDVDFKWIASKTDEYSGADLAHLCESAAELAMEDSLATGTARPITQSDFKKVLKEVKPSTRPWFDMARNYAMFSNEGGVYDDLLNYLRQRRLI